MTLVVIFLISSLAAIAYSWHRGGQPEQIGAAIFAVMLAVDIAGHRFAPFIYKEIDPISVGVDLIGLIGFSWLGIVSGRLWPLWAASLQLLSTGAHFVRALAIPVRPPVYYWMKSVPTMAIILLLIVGTWAHRRRLRRSTSSRS